MTVRLRPVLRLFRAAPSALVALVGLNILRWILGFMVENSSAVLRHWQITITSVVPILVTILAVLYLIVVAVRLFRLPYFTVGPAVIAIHPVTTVHPDVDRFTREFTLRENATLTVNRGQLEIARPDGSRTKLPVKQWMAHPKDWQAVIDAIPDAPLR